MNSCPSPAGPRRVALIFDDGPHAPHMPAYLELFSREKVRVNFAHIGRNVATHPDLVRAAHQAGHEIVNHSYSHPHFNALDAGAMRKELDDTQREVISSTGAAPRWFWPPYGDREDHVISGVAATGIALFPIQKFHFVSTRDWDVNLGAESIFDAATREPSDKTVICFHEWRVETLAVMPRIIANLKDQGCRFLTFSEMAAT